MCVCVGGGGGRGEQDKDRVKLEHYNIVCGVYRAMKKCPE